MPAVPQTKATWTNGTDPLNSTNLHAYLRDPINFLMNKPVAELRATATQSINSATWTACNFNVETVDTDLDNIGGHSTASNTSRYTARYPGWYKVSGSTGWAGNSTGRRGVRFAVNGTAVNGSGALVGAAGTSSGVGGPVLVRLEEGDYVEMQLFQDSGAALATSASAEIMPHMTVEWSRL